MKKLKVLISDDQKNIKIPSGIRLLIRRCCVATMQEIGFEPFRVEVSVRLVNNDGIRQLNKEYRNKDESTDVLSFPQYHAEELKTLEQEKSIIFIGDVVMSVEKAMTQAEKYEHSFQREVAFLMVHSMLHLLGYNHEEGGLEAIKMREKEEMILTKLGVPRGAGYVVEYRE